MVIDIQSLEEMARKPANTGAQGRSMRSIVAANLDKIEAARVNGWPLASIAASLGIDCANPGSRLSAYLTSLKKGAERRKPAPVSAPVAAPVAPTAAPEPPKFIPGQLPPIPGYEAPKPNMSPELAELARRAEERSAERRAAKAARESQPKEE